MDIIKVLTIQRNLDRHVSVNNILKGMEFEFIYGLDLTVLYPECKNIHDLPDSFFKEFNIDKNSFLGYTKGQLGAYTSIRNMILDVIEKELQYALFFEDDFYPIVKDWKAKYKNASSELPEDWDILFLGYNYDGFSYRFFYKRWVRFFLNGFYFLKNILGIKSIKVVPKKYSSHLDYSGICNGGHAYSISKKGAKLLNEYFSPMKASGDVLISSLIENNKINAYCVYPCLFIQNPKFESKTRLSV